MSGVLINNDARKESDRPAAAIKFFLVCSKAKNGGLCRYRTVDLLTVQAAFITQAEQLESRESAITERLARRAASLVKSLIELQSGYQLTRDQGFESLRRANTALHECFTSVTLHYEEKALGLRWRNGDVSRPLYGSSLTGRAL